MNKLQAATQASGLKCPVHDRPLTCSACLGAAGGKRGGKALTKAKLRQLKRAAKRPRPRSIAKID